MTALERSLPDELIGPPTAARHLTAAAARDGDVRSDAWRRAAKRGMDIGIVLVSLPLLLPLMAVIAIAIRLRSPGPVLFRQERLGRHGQTFSVLKFRTMHVDATERLRRDPELYARYVANDFKLPLADDPRIIPGGRFLRRTSLDELPQVFNVLSGKMSVVGPRPIVPGELVRYGTHAWAYLEVRPGITGRWQCEGRNQIRYPQRARIDADYVANWSLRTDVLILLKTVPTVLRRHGCW